MAFKTLLQLWGYLKLTSRHCLLREKSFKQTTYFSLLGNFFFLFSPTPTTESSLKRIQILHLQVMHLFFFLYFYFFLHY